MTSRSDAMRFMIPAVIELDPEAIYDNKEGTIRVKLRLMMLARMDLQPGSQSKVIQAQVQLEAGTNEQIARQVFRAVSEMLGREEEHGGTPGL